MRASTRTLAIVQAGGKGSRLDVLTRERAKPALPFAGTYQLIDFALTNLTHSGISDVWLSVQYQAGSLHDHLASGRPWDLDRTRGGLRWLMPEEGRALDRRRWLRQRQRRRPAPVLRLHPRVRRGCRGRHEHRPGDGHRPARSGGRAPAAAGGLHHGHHRGEPSAGRQQGGADRRRRLPGHGRGRQTEPTPTGTTISAEVFVYDPEVLCSTLDTLRRERSHTDGSNTGIGDFGEHLIPRLVDHGNVHAWAHHGYWADLGTPSSYLRAHRDLLSGKVDAVGATAWPVLTRAPELPAARIAAGAVLEDSWVSPGCHVAGTVRRSVLGPGTVVAAGAVVEDSVLGERVRVDRDAHVGTSVLDEGVHVEAGSHGRAQPRRATGQRRQHRPDWAGQRHRRQLRDRVGCPTGARVHQLTKHDQTPRYSRKLAEACALWGSNHGAC